MNDVELSQTITNMFKGTDVEHNDYGYFFFYNPDADLPPDHMFPIMTIVTNDLNDTFSNLERPDVYRLNIGVSKATFRSLFGEPDEGKQFSGYDYTALDVLMPHPVYAAQYWVSVINPSDEVFQSKVEPLMDEAYDMAVTKYNKKAAKS